MRTQKSVIFLLGLITLLGGYFRGVNLNWDHGQGFHPDELNIALAVKEVNFPEQFDPKFYAYGTVPIYTIRIVAQVLANITDNQSWIHDTGSITYIGRILSSATSTLTIPAVYFLALTILSPINSLFVAFITATTPILIQYAHFSVTESAITLCAVLIAYLSVTWQTVRSYKTIIVCGIIIGASIATKISTLTYILFPFISFCIGFFSKTHFFSSSKKIVIVFLYLLITSLCVFIIASSITFIYPFETLNSLIYERGVVTGSIAVFYTNQFIHTTPYFFHISQLPQTMGYPMMALSLLGMVIVVIDAVKKLNARHLIVFSWMYVYLAIIGAWYAKFIRYTIPSYPFLFILAIYALSKIVKQIPSYRMRLGVVSILVFMQLFQSVSFISIYTHPQTRHLALAWIHTETPENARILTDDASDFLPETNQESPEQVGRTVIQIPHFGLESEEEIHNLAENLSFSDYYVIGTRRQLGVVVNHPNEFPNTAHFYDALFDGSLGYTHVSSFSSYPTISFLGKTISFPDDSYEETMQVFDHPTIIIFKNTNKYEAKTILQTLSGT